MFRSTAEGETGHAHGHLEYLEDVGGPATDMPIGPAPENLAAAITGETHEPSDMYPGMARTARAQGFDEIAEWFETLATTEMSIARRLSRDASGLYATCFVNCNNPGIGEATRAVLARNGVETEVSYPRCCGMPQFAQEMEIEAGGRNPAVSADAPDRAVGSRLWHRRSVVGREELEACNPLIPQGSELSAAVMFDIDDPVRRAETLTRLDSIEHRAFVDVAGVGVRSEPDPTRENTSPEGKASSVQFLKFSFAPQQIE
jgi:hypothetical protein